MTTKKDIEKMLEEQLDSFSTKIDKLDAKMKQEKEHASEIEHRALKNLIAMRSNAKTKLQSFKDAGEEKWEELGLSLDQYWQSLGSELKAYDGRL